MCSKFRELVSSHRILIKYLLLSTHIDNWLFSLRTTKWMIHIYICWWGIRYQIIVREKCFIQTTDKTCVLFQSRNCAHDFIAVKDNKWHYHQYFSLLFAILRNQIIKWQVDIIYYQQRNPSNDSKLLEFCVCISFINVHKKKISD